jgi:predicted nucleic acid-binding protein
MIVVSDTSPLRYLVLIRAIDVLPRIFGEVVIPPAVAAELTHPNTPTAVRPWFSSMPTWIKIQAPRRVDVIDRIDPGELEAIALALELDADRLIMDDNAGKKAAKRLGITTIGTLAILDLAGKQGWLNFPQTLDELESTTNFRLSRELRDRLIDEHRKTSEP